MAAVGHTGLNNMLAAYSDKSAQAVCTFAYSEGPGHEPIIFQGRTDVRSSNLKNISLIKIPLLTLLREKSCQHGAQQYLVCSKLWHRASD